MSLLNRKTDPTQGKQAEQPSLFKAPAIAEKLAVAEAKLANLETRHRQAAFESVSGVSGGNENLVAIEAEVAEASRTISTLRKAHSAAIEHDEREKRGLFAEQMKSQIRVCRSHLSARDAAAEALSIALADAVKQWRLLINHSAKAKSAIAVGIKWPSGVPSEFHEITRLVKHEIYRLGGDPAIGSAHSFPGGEPPSLSYSNQPENIKPILATLSEATQHVITMLTGKITG